MCWGVFTARKPVFFSLEVKDVLQKNIHVGLGDGSILLFFFTQYYYCLISEKEASKFLGGTNSGQTGYKVKKPNSETGFSEPRASTSSGSGRQTQDEAED